MVDEGVAKPAFEEMEWVGGERKQEWGGVCRLFLEMVREDAEREWGES